MFTGERCHRVNVCGVLAHFYCRKPNWSARVYYYYHSSPSNSPLSLSSPFFKSLFRESTPTWLEPRLPRHGSNPISRPEYKSRCFLFREFPEQDFLNAIITINEEEANGCIGPLPFSGLSLLSFRSSGEPLKEARPLVAFLSFRRLSPPSPLLLRIFIQSTAEARRERRRRKKFRGRS